MEEEYNRVLEPEEVIEFFSRPLAKFPKSQEIIKIPHSEEYLPMVRKYFEDVPRIDLNEIAARERLLCGGSIPPFRLVSPSNIFIRNSPELKGGSVPNKDLGESNETKIETSNPAADSSATAAPSGIKAEA